MNNTEVAEEFVNDNINSDWEVKGNSMFKRGRAIYSYGYHFPIAFKLEDNVFLFNEDGYSYTTARHKSVVKRAIGNNKCFLMSTKELKYAIEKGFANLKEIMLDKFYQGITLKGG